MFERFGNDAAGPIQQLSEIRLTRQIGSQYEGIDEQARWPYVRGDSLSSSDWRTGGCKWMKT